MQRGYPHQERKGKRRHPLFTQGVILEFNSFSRKGNFSTLIVGGFGLFSLEVLCGGKKEPHWGVRPFLRGGERGNMCRFVSGIRKNLVYIAFRGGKSGLKPYVSRE